MRCPHLAKDVIYICESGREPTIPGSPRLNKYCKNEGYPGCPMYIAHIRSVGYLGFTLAA